MAIKLLVTGGRFDKEYNEFDGSLVFKKTHVYQMLEAGRCKEVINVRTVMLIDSLDMTDTDRRIIADYCVDSEENRIIITHGTDTMVETAHVLAKENKINNKTIVLTGAMVPYIFGSSDGLFNLGLAIAFVQVLPAGVYIAMNGRALKHDNVRKDKEKGEFVSLK